MEGDTDPYRELFEQSADAILIIEGEHFVACNQAAVEMLRCHSRDQVMQMHPSELSPPTQPDGRRSYEKANEMISIAMETGSHRFEWAHKRADGEVFPVEVLLTAVRRGGKRVLHVVWRDITERKQLEAQLRQAQKLEAIGKLAGGVAHDFNNLLVAILGNSEMLRLRIEDDPELLRHVEEIHQAGNRAAALVRQLLAFSRKQEVVPRVFDVNALLGDCEGMLTRMIGEDVTVELRTADGPILVRADPTQTEQVIFNLATNARDAMPRGGRLTLELESVSFDDMPIGAADSLRPGTYARLTVTDTGVGMDEETIARAFEPFFTTKSVGQGTGLGLAMVYGIAKQSGGDVQIRSIPGRGTTVSVYLPSAKASEVDRSSTRPAAPPVSRGNETVLVVEDEPAVSRLVVEVLEDRGYEVLLASDGNDALERWRGEREAVDLVVTDVVMPSLGGVEMVQELRQQGYGGPVLFMSGYSAGGLSRLEEMEESIDLIEKPFSPAELLVRVRRALDRGREDVAPMLDA